MFYCGYETLEMYKKGAEGIDFDKASKIDELPYWDPKGFDYFFFSGS